MSIEEQYLSVTHKHNNCPICDGVKLIEDIPTPRSSWERFVIAANNFNATVRIMQGKRIEVKEG